jgi:hypothetical protein
MINIPKLFLAFVFFVYSLIQLIALLDSKRIYQNIKSSDGNNIISIIHSILYLFLSPGGLIAIATILIILSEKFNNISLIQQPIIVIILIILFFINIITSYMFGGVFYIWIVWQVILAFLLKSCGLIF